LARRSRSRRRRRRRSLRIVQKSNLSQPGGHRRASPCTRLTGYYHKQVESLKEALKEVDCVAHLQWAAVAGLVLLLCCHAYAIFTAKGEEAPPASASTKAKARSWLSSLKANTEGRATEAVAAPEVRMVGTPDSKRPPVSRAKSVRKAAAKMTGMSGAFSGKAKAEAGAAPSKKEAVAALNARGRDGAADAAEANVSTQEKVVAKVEETADQAEAAASTKVDAAAAAAKAETAAKVAAVSESWASTRPRSRWRSSTRPPN